MTIGPNLAANAQIARMYAQNVLKGVTQANYARLATANGKAIQSNHPAWVLGHCAYYFANAIELSGGMVKPAGRPAGYEDLFKNGSTCQDDPNGTIYPPLAELSAYYESNLAEAIEALKIAPDAVLNMPHLKDGKPHPYFPTNGSLAGFLTVAHPLNHLGQVSAWRRVIGLGPAT
jgi:hypothetical protein